MQRVLASSQMSTLHRPAFQTQESPDPFAALLTTKSKPGLARRGQTREQGEKQRCSSSDPPFNFLGSVSTASEKTGMMTDCVRWS
jgi:hypothetical protein